LEPVRPDTKHLDPLMVKVLENEYQGYIGVVVAFENLEVGAASRHLTDLV
jgi:hypothetical protein